MADIFSSNENNIFIYKCVCVCYVDLKSLLEEVAFIIHHHLLLLLLILLSVLLYFADEWWGRGMAFFFFFTFASDLNKKRGYKF